jgi:hypothetical protein
MHQRCLNSCKNVWRWAVVKSAMASSRASIVSIPYRSSAGHSSKLGLVSAPDGSEELRKLQVSCVCHPAGPCHRPAGLHRGKGGAWQNGAGQPGAALAIRRTGPDLPSVNSNVNLPAASGFELSASVSQPVQATCLPSATVQRMVATSATGSPSSRRRPRTTGLSVMAARFHFNGLCRFSNSLLPDGIRPRRRPKAVVRPLQQDPSGPSWPIFRPASPSVATSGSARPHPPKGTCAPCTPRRILGRSPPPASTGLGN